MNTQRNFLIIILVLVSFLLWQMWQNDNKLNTIDKHVISNNKYLLNNKNYIVTVITDTLLLKINPYNFAIEQALLLKYPKYLKSRESFKLLDTSSNFIYQLKSSLSSDDYFSKNLINQLRFCNKKMIYVLKNNKKDIKVPFIYKYNNKFTYIKTFILKRNSYKIDIIDSITNNTNKIIPINIFGQIQQSINIPNQYNNNFINGFYRNISYSTDHENYKKYNFEEIKNYNLLTNTSYGWIAMSQKYFITTLIIPNIGINNIYTKKIDDSILIGFKNKINIGAYSKKNICTAIWIGPKLQSELKLLANNLDLTIDYGWLWFISQPLFKLLNYVTKYTNNWGLSIIITTIIVRIILYPLTKTQYISMAKIRLLQPKINMIRKKFKDNKQQQSKEILLLYKKKKVNPFGGCLPVIIQMPIFLGLYYVLSESVELRHANFCFWIHDLSSQDPYYILPIIMGITMYIIQKISSNNVEDLIQKKISTIMPIIFTLFFFWFPSGLVLYYIISNIITIIQQQIIFRSIK
ncbi:MAG: membrane protein insertase YidC [Candidatus Lightella neohaematopini]|nr:membrane protein insertase YidC [Candidatus Lightella neohaematopini]MCV2528795.1 membrane protein insertase YidC [Candidatus Lightella neohaematopini]